MRISKITVQKKKKDRYHLFVEDEGTEQYIGSVGEEVLLNWNIHKGKMLSSTDLKRILEEEEKAKVFQVALTYLQYQMRTEQEVRNYLFKKEYEDTWIDEAITKLKKLRYIDDVEYARLFVSSRMRLSDKGPRFIREELKQKGIPEEIIEEAILRYDEEEQVKVASKFLQKKGKQKSNESYQMMKNRLLASLERKGFSKSIAIKAWEQSNLSFTKDEEWSALYKEGKKALNKWQRKYDGFELKQKIKQTLYRKGFQLEDIERYIEQVEKEVEENGEKI